MSEEAKKLIKIIKHGYLPPLSYSENHHTNKTKIGQLYFGMDFKRCWECEYKNRTPIRDNLLVTAGARVAYMHDKGIINIPDGLKGEDEIARFITRLVDEYLESDPGNFDIWLEEALMKGYGVKDVR